MQTARALPLDVVLRGFGLDRVVEHGALADPDPEACTTLAEPGRVVPHEVPGAELVDGALKAVPGPLPWNVVRLA
ncbi:hypothetical protein [Streptomyces filamentosus]|uniref:hypothetical protein n=1 Tax=Streptomyces filamentosus TaxID=67294 RepID=UPI001238800D|nr:hypothetical protein [Streptomyces filamentosus]KAA6210915.1 hypothetical protein CP979_30975 [Streptomyces filamentosus]